MAAIKKTVIGRRRRRYEPIRRRPLAEIFCNTQPRPNILWTLIKQFATGGGDYSYLQETLQSHKKKRQQKRTVLWHTSLRQKIPSPMREWKTVFSEAKWQRRSIVRAGGRRRFAGPATIGGDLRRSNGTKQRELRQKPSTWTRKGGLRDVPA